MADIELVIKIDEEDYKKVLDTNNRECEWNNMHRCYETILNGTPLPKGHGKLGDLDILLNKAMRHFKSYADANLEDSSYCRGKLHAYELYVEEVENADTIIEADKAESEG